MVATDDRFLTVHPRTALWWQQREKCLQCANMSRMAGTAREATHTAMKCSAVGGGGTNSRGDSSCIAARDEGPNLCGPRAKLYRPA